MATSALFPTALKPQALSPFSSSLVLLLRDRFLTVSSLPQGRKIRHFDPEKLVLGFNISFIESKRRRTLICAVNQGAEESFKKTVEVDRLIDMLRDANPSELHQLVVENVLAFNEGFWIRLAARTDTCMSEDDKARLLNLFSLVLFIWF
uniref:Uncharacterized protein LOC105134468 isoform X2 n=1 Tax=Rhizophora mucronata TaxID=61149 RepID=A0A2P2KWD8_RHIMU